MSVFLDKTGCDQRNSLRKCGYSLHGKPAVSKKLIVRGERVPAVAFMSVNGMLDLKVVSGNVNGDNLFTLILLKRSCYHILCPLMVGIHTVLSFLITVVFTTVRKL